MMLFRGHGSFPSEVNDSDTAPPQAQFLTVEQHDVCEMRVQDACSDFQGLVRMVDIKKNGQELGQRRNEDWRGRVL